MKLTTLLIASLLCNSCTFYARDAIEGSPYKRSYEPSYENAVNEGLSEESASRRALLVGSDSSRKKWDERKAKRKKQRDSGEKFRWFRFAWD